MNPLELAPLETRTVPDLMARSAAFGLERSWVVEASTGKTLCYGEFLERTASTALKLSRQFPRGAHIALMLSNHIEFFIVRFAISCAGLVEISLNGDQKGSVLKGMLETAKPQGFIVEDAYLENLNGCAFDHASTPKIVGAQIAALCADRAPWDSRPDVHIEPHDTCRILFTSGTTGVSKGVVLSHAYEVFVGHRWGGVLELTPDDRFFYTTRLFHADAQGLVSAFLHRGASTVIVEKFSASQFWPVAVRYQATCFMHVGTILAILNRGPVPPPEHNIRLAFGAGCSLALWRDWTQRTGIALLEGFGMSECLACTFTSAADPVPGSAGKALPGVEIAIVDAFDRRVPCGMRGELVIRSQEPFAMLSEYLDNPGVTLERFRNLWFHTGDLGSMDEEGNLYFHGRMKDSLRVKGENISAEELQHIVDSHPGVVVSAAVGVPSIMGDEDILLYVHRSASHEVTEEEICRFVEARAVSFMVPRYVRFIDSLPVSVSEKVSKTTLSRVPDEKTWVRPLRDAYAGAADAVFSDKNGTAN